MAILELTCSLPVIVAASDGASANRKFYRTHAAMDKKQLSIALSMRMLLTDLYGCLQMCHT